MSFYHFNSKLIIHKKEKRKRKRLPYKPRTYFVAFIEVDKLRTIGWIGLSLPSGIKIKNKSKHTI
jgi:hypothetical protein